MAPHWDLRLAGPADDGAIAALHADSWRRHYRAAYSDAFLDGDVLADRLKVWTERLGRADAGSWTVLAEAADSVIGFAHVIFDDDATWGSLLDNIHVAHAPPTSRRRLGATRPRGTSGLRPAQFGRFLPLGSRAERGSPGLLQCLRRETRRARASRPAGRRSGEAERIAIQAALRVGRSQRVRWAARGPPSGVLTIQTLCTLGVQTTSSIFPTCGSRELGVEA
jgi:hypothetical protein